MKHTSYIIKSNAGYWNNKIGWCEDISSADKFSREERETFNLPIGDNVSWHSYTKYSDKEVEIFNAMLNAYRCIESDGSLERNKLTYKEYQSLGFLMDCLRFDKIATTAQKGVADWFEGFGFVVSNEGTDYKIELK